MQLGFPAVLGLIFITLKLTGHVAWPWLWVLAPFWIPVALTLAFLALLAVIQAVLGSSVAIKRLAK